MRRATLERLPFRAALAAVCLVPALLVAQEPAQPRSPAPAVPTLDALMSARDYRATGVSRLSAAERAALERWLARYTTTVAAAARSAARAQDSARAPAPLAEVVRPSRSTAAQVALGAIVEVASVLSGGGFLVLADGTMWEVWVGDQIKTAVWSPGDRVIVREQAAPPAEFFRLQFENGRAGSMVTVRYAGSTGAPSVGHYDQTTAPTVFGEASYYSPYVTYDVYVPFGAFGVCGWNCGAFNGGNRHGRSGFDGRGGVHRRGRLDALPNRARPTRTVGVRPSGVRPSRGPQVAPPPRTNAAPSTSAAPRMSAPPRMMPAPRP